MLEAHKAKDVELYTSVLTVVECIHADGSIDDKTKNLFIRVLSSGQYVSFVQPTPFLASDARDLRWKHGINLSGGDYLHVASGLAVGCGEFLTTDAKISGQGAKIAGLGMKIVRPSATVLLPASYRQKDLLHENVVTPIRPKAGQAPPPAGN